MTTYPETSTWTPGEASEVCTELAEIGAALRRPRWRLRGGRR